MSETGSARQKHVDRLQAELDELDRKLADNAPNLAEARVNLKAANADLEYHSFDNWRSRQKNNGRSIMICYSCHTARQTRVKYVVGTCSQFVPPLPLSLCALLSMSEDEDG
jgi:hypothetical protein